MKYHLGNCFHKECAWYVSSIFLQQEQLHKKIKKQSSFWDSRWTVFNSAIARLCKLHCFKEILLEEIDTLLQEYENKNRKNILSYFKEILTNHNSTLVEYFDYIFKKNNLITLHVTRRKQKLCSKHYRLFRTLVCWEYSCE